MIRFLTGPWTPWKLCICSRDRRMRLTWALHSILTHKNVKEKPGARFFSYRLPMALLPCFTVFLLNVVHVVLDSYLVHSFFFFYSASSDDQSFNKVAERVLMRLQEKLKGVEEGTVLSVGGQVNLLIQQAMDPKNLSRLFPGWKAWVWLGRIQHIFRRKLVLCSKCLNISNWYFTIKTCIRSKCEGLYVVVFGGCFGFFFNNLLLRKHFFCPLMFTVQYKTPTGALMFLVTCKDFAWAYWMRYVVKAWGSSLLCVC